MTVYSNLVWQVVNIFHWLQDLYLDIIAPLPQKTHNEVELCYHCMSHLKYYEQPIASSISGYARKMLYSVFSQAQHNFEINLIPLRIFLIHRSIPLCHDYLIVPAATESYLPDPHFHVFCLFLFCRYQLRSKACSRDIWNLYLDGTWPI